MPLVNRAALSWLSTVAAGDVTISSPHTALKRYTPISLPLKSTPIGASTQANPTVHKAGSWRKVNVATVPNASAAAVAVPVGASAKKVVAAPTKPTTVVAVSQSTVIKVTALTRDNVKHSLASGVVTPAAKLESTHQEKSECKAKTSMLKAKMPRDVQDEDEVANPQSEYGPY